MYVHVCIAPARIVGGVASYERPYPHNEREELTRLCEKIMMFRLRFVEFEMN